MNNDQDSTSLTTFKRNSAETLKRLKKTGRPLVITHKGKPEVIVQSAESYRRLLDRLDYVDAVEGIRRGLDSMEKGESIDAVEALNELRRKRRIPRA